MTTPLSIHVGLNSPTNTSTMDRAQMINFLREYRVLECACCSAVFGFQHKISGVMYCLDGCHERSPPTAEMMQPNPMGSAVIPPAGLMNGNTPITMISNGLHGTVRSVPNSLADYKQPVIMPIAARVPPTAEAVIPISARKVVEDPPVEEKAKAQEAVPMPVKTAKVGSSVQQSMPAIEKVTPTPPQSVPVIEKVIVTPSQPQSSLGTAEARATTSQSKNFPGTGEVRVAPQQIKSNVHVPLSKTNVFQASVDVPDARINEPKPVPPVIVIVEHNPNVALSRANIPWPEYRTSESLKCTVVFDCGDGGFFLQSSDPRVLESVNRVVESIVDFVRSGKCKSLVKPAVGALCLAEEAGGKWRTFFIDYGNTEILSAGDFFILPDELKKEPRLCTFGYWDQVLAEHKKSDEVYNIGEIETVPTLVTFLKKITDGQYIVQIGEAAKATFEVEIPVSIPVPVQEVQSPPQWAYCIFSPNLLAVESVVRIIHGWDTLTYHIMADADEESVTKFQALIAEYALEAESLTRSPCLGEIVVAPYDGVYYRGKADKVEGDNCTCTFVDYGDSKVIKISDIKPVNDAIMKYPVYGMKIRLAKIPDPPQGFVMDDRLDDLIYASGYYMDVKQKGGIKPADVPHFDARLWDLKKENLLNEAIKVAIAKYSLLPQLTSARDEEQEIAYLLSTDDFFRGTKIMVEEFIQHHNPETFDTYVFKLDNAEYPYFMPDLPLLPLSYASDVFEVEIAQFNSVSNLIVRPTGDVFKKKLENLNVSIGLWIKSCNQRDMHGFVTVPGFDVQQDQLCLVKWPKWEEVNYMMECMTQKEWWKRNYEDMGLDIFADDYATYSGKWFRAAFQNAYYIDSDKKKALIYDMFLVNIGKVTLIPTEYVYKMPHRFVLDYQMTIFLNVQLDNIIQYSNEVDEKWKSLLLPGMKIKVKVVWMLDEVFIVKLIEPTEEQFEAHYKRPYIQKRISDWKKQVHEKQRHRQVKGMSKLKGSFQLNMEKVLAQEEREKKFQPEKDKYSQIGRVNYERVFNLQLSHPQIPHT